jgi:hypothetical protein
LRLESGRRNFPRRGEKVGRFARVEIDCPDESAARELLHAALFKVRGQFQNYVRDVIHTLTGSLQDTNHLIYLDDLRTQDLS